MSAHESIETSMWSDPAILALRANARLLYVWSFTNPRCNLLGIYKVARAQMRLETGLAEGPLNRALDECDKLRFLFYDGTYCFVRSRVKRLQSKSPNAAKSIGRELGKLDSRHPFVQSFVYLYKETPWEPLRRVLEGFDSPSADPLAGVTE